MRKFIPAFLVSPAFFVSLVSLVSFATMLPLSARATTPPLTQAETKLAANLYTQLSQRPGNLFFSPSSISTALGMLFIGARSATAAEIAHALHLGLIAPGADIAAQQAAYLRAAQVEPLSGSVSGANGQPSGFTLHAANALWGATGYHFNPAYLAALQSGFGASLHTQNFANEPAARAAINGWVAAATHNKIRNLIAPGMLGARTRLVLTNAIYFNATWHQPFRPRDTAPATFHAAPGQNITTPMMNLVDDFPLAAVPGAHILAMDYSGGLATMVIILPDAPFGLPAIEKNLSAATLTGWLTAGHRTLVALSLPKFSTESRLNLGGALQALGIRLAFSDQADLSGIARDPARQLNLSDVVHQAQISVDETATEAAAATSMTFMATAMPPSTITVQPVPFIADHPFLYLIRDNRNGEILFMGRESNPAS